MPGITLAPILRDPVVTSNGDRLRFESFSSCCGVHARLDLLPGALAEPPLASGTTNVDFNAAMRGALAEAAISGPLLLSVGSDEVVVDTLGGSVAERKIPLPEHWLKGFGEVQAIARTMRPIGELTGVAAQRFIRSIPREAKRPLWAAPASGTFALTTRARAGAACIAGPHRLVELGQLLRFARRLRVYGPKVDASTAEAPSAWELDLGSARFTLTVSPEKYRGFSGEGALLELLGDEEVAADALKLGSSLTWHSQIDADALAAMAGLTRQRVSDALRAASGQVGYDLAEAGAIQKPSVPEYAVLPPRISEANPADMLLADPELLDDEVWRLFTTPDAGAELEKMDAHIGYIATLEHNERGAWPTQTWAQGLAQLSRQGHLDRDRLIDESLRAFARDFNPNRVAWYATMLAELQLSITEVATREPAYLGLLGANSKFGVTLAQQAAGQLPAAGLLHADKLLAVSAPALLFPQKSIAMAQLKLIAKVMARIPEAAPEGAAALAIAFGHQRQDVQEAALALIVRHGIPEGAALAEIRLRAMDLSPSLAAQAAAAGDVPRPMPVLPGPGATLPEPITEAEELVHILSILIEDARDAIAAERAIAGAVRLCHMPERERRQAVAPLVKRAARVLIYPDRPFKGDKINADIALITKVWAGEPMPRRDDYWDYESRPGDCVIDSSGRARTMTGIFSARAWEAAKVIEAGRGGLLLAEPETDRGAITAECLLDRLRRLRREQRPLAGPWDRDAALLRLAPKAPESVWSAWSELDKTRADS